MLAILVLGGCATAPPSRDAWSVSDAGRAATDPRRQAVLHEADAQIGTPYRYGGADPRGFDCSGLVQFVYRSVGLAVPRTAAAQRRHAQPVAVDHLQAGDLVFFRIVDGKGDHVGIYAGDGWFIHAPSGGKAVSRASLANPYWRSQLAGAGTYL